MRGRVKESNESEIGFMRQVLEEDDGERQGDEDRV